MSYTFKRNADENLKTLVNKAIKMCQDANIPISDYIEFGYDNAENRHGVCKHNTRTGFNRITISKYLVKDADKLNTIIHELLHSCPDGHSHGYGWQRHADKIYSTYKIRITRCSDKEHDPTPISSSRRKYYTAEEYANNKNILVAIGIAGENEPRWFVKKNSKMAIYLDNFSYRGRKLVVLKNA